MLSEEEVIRLNREWKGRVISIDSLGACNQCGALFIIADLPTDDLFEGWKCCRGKEGGWFDHYDKISVCPQCGNELTNESFGYEKTEKGWQKVRWIGSDKKWTETKPERCFEFGFWKVIPNPRQMPVVIGF